MRACRWTTYGLERRRRAKLVKREVAEAAKDGTARMVKVAIDPDDVFACRVRGEDVTVITTDGQRLYRAAAGRRRQGRQVKNIPLPG